MRSGPEQELVEAIARRVVELLREDSPAGVLVDATELAKHLGVSRQFVYRHKHELHAQRLAAGPKSPLRFDLRRAEAALRGVATEARPPARKAPARPPATVPLLPVRPR